MRVWQSKTSEATTPFEATAFVAPISRRDGGPLSAKSTPTVIARPIHEYSRRDCEDPPVVVYAFRELSSDGVLARSDSLAGHALCKLHFVCAKQSARDGGAIYERAVCGCSSFLAV